MFSLESPHRGDSNEYTHYTIFNKKITLNSPKSAAMGFFIGTRERVRDSRGKRAISVRVIEVLLYFDIRGYFEISVVEISRVGIHNAVSQYR